MDMRNRISDAVLFRRRTITAWAVVVVIAFGLSSRFLYLQVSQHESLTAQSDNNRIKIEPLAANRGLIYDRNGEILADNRPAYRLSLTSEHIADMDATLQALAEVIDLSEESISRFQQLAALKHRFQGVPLKFRLTEEEVARFAVLRYRFPGVEVIPYLTRHYPRGDQLAHVIGYVGRMDSRDVQNVDPGVYRATTHIGKSGVERFYEERLHGKPGLRRMEVSAEGRSIRELERSAPISGESLRLTIDANLQLAAIKALGAFAGAVVVLAPSNGEVLALVSQPSFDPNPFVGGVSRQHYAQLLSSNKRPLFNRAIQGGYEPGSTMKPFIALAGLRSEEVEPEDTVHSIGYFQLPNQERKYRDWKRGGHGVVDLRDALIQSVNVYFYELAVRLGIDRLEENLAPFGLGAKTGIDLMGENPGVLPSRAWKRKKKGLPWFPGETVIAGIGQGFFVVTPLQLARAVTVIASRGKLVQPHLLMDRQTLHEKQISVEPEHWDVVIDGMIGVVNDIRGTARRIGAGSRFLIAGKTGTAQVYGQEEDEEYVESEVAEHLRHHALFVAFAPADAPEVVVAVVAEHGGGGARVAAPIARKVIDAYMDTPLGKSALRRRVPEKEGDGI